MPGIARRSCTPHVIACALACAIVSTAQAQTSDQAPRITHGPILGRVAEGSIGVWVRSERPGRFVVRYGAAEGRLDQTSPTIETSLAHDNTGWVQIDGLAGDTRYYYVVTPDGAAATADSPGGNFLTLPVADDVRDAEHNPKGLFNFTFDTGSCANQGPHGLGPSLPLYGTMLREAADRVHFAMLNGDWLYEDPVRGLPLADWQKQVGVDDAGTPPLVALVPPIVGVWENYKLYLTQGKNLAAWHRRVPSFFTFDDHEILNDVMACGTPGIYNRRTVFRDIAVQAWYDYIGWSNPVASQQPIHFGRATVKAGDDVLVDDAADFTKLNLDEAGTLHIHWGTPDAGVDYDTPEPDFAGGAKTAGVYEIVEIVAPTRVRVRPAPPADEQVTYSIGRTSHFKQRVANCEFYYLDTRTHRQKHDLKNLWRSDISMLGERQRKWLLDSMAASDADFFFVASTVPFTIPHVDAGGMAYAAPDKDDAWTAFLYERDLLIKAWDALNKPVFVLTGDLHNSFAVKVTDRVWEFCCGPHNSSNHPASSEGNRPPNGPFDSRGRECEIYWSTYCPNDTPIDMRRRPIYCLVQVNNVFNAPIVPNEKRWFAYPIPQVVFQYYEGMTGELLYAQSFLAR